MATTNAGVKAARAAMTNSHEFANEKVDPSCTKCLETPPIRAIILYPNIGTPLIVPPGEEYLTFFIAAENSSREHFGVRRSGPNNFPAPAVSGYRYVDKHLRFHSISNKKVKEDTDEGRLWNDGKLCGKAYDNVKVWCIGRLSKDFGTITDIDGNIFANIRPRTLEQYGNIKTAHPDPEDKNVENVPLVWVYQIRIKLESIPQMPAAGSIGSLAWVVSIPEKYRKQASLSGMSDWEYQDKLIYDFLEAQKKNPKKSHIPDFYEFSLTTETVSSTLPDQSKKVSHRLKAWHPFVIGTKSKLSIGHLSDVHINCRQFAMAKSDAQVIEGVSPKLGPKIDITFVALKNLFDEMKKEGADAIFVTGDLLDFNRNIDPNKIGNEVADQWKKFNVSKNINDPTLYKRGFDDMLMYSLLRYSYEILKLPVFVTTGNHEAYDVPYGISPRTNKKTKLTGILEKVGLVAAPGSVAPPESPEIKKEADWKTEASFAIDTMLSLTPTKLLDKSIDETILAVKKEEANADINSYVLGKANEGIPADHNLTVYEACLVYGPTFAQVLTSQNFTADNYDWFFTLFTPLADFVVDYGGQRIIGLDWGSSERFVSLEGHLNPLNNDHQGMAFLPRAPESINKLQKELLESAFYLRKPKPKTTLLFSHFPFINFDMDVPFMNGSEPNIVEHRVEDLNKFNFGTCEKEQRWLYDNCINGKVQYHFSGHSHRSGVYTVGDLKAEPAPSSARFGSHNKINPGRDICSVTGFDPGLHPKHKDNKVTNRTKLIVSSCGGPIGVQNQNQELYAFNMQLPSGTLLNEDAMPPIRLVKADPQKVSFAEPRLCVALDYLWVMWKTNGGAEEPICFKNPDFGSIAPRLNAMPQYLDVRLGRKIRALDCIADISFFVYMRSGQSGGFIKILTTFEEKNKSAAFSHRITFNDKASIEKLNSIIKNYLPASPPVLFCEVKLKKPIGDAVQHFNWIDNWYFPVHLEQVMPMRWTISRPSGELGEVPNWPWLNQSFPKKYPSAGAISR